MQGTPSKKVEDYKAFKLSVQYFSSGEGEPLADLIVEREAKASAEELDFIHRVTVSGLVRWLYYGNSKVN